MSNGQGRNVSELNDYYEVADDEHNYKPGVMVLCNNE